MTAEEWIKLQFECAIKMMNQESYIAYMVDCYKDLQGK
jgi:hypothetical protein